MAFRPGEQSGFCVGPVLADARRRIAAVSDTAGIDAFVLLEHCCGVGRAAAMGFPERTLERDAVAALDRAVERRLAGEPVAYICGCREFYSLQLAVSPAVLVPRPDTELLVDACIERIGDAGCRVLDLGTGSGAIAIAVKKARPAAAVTATDFAADALSVAAENAATHSAAIEFVRSDWFVNLGKSRFDVVISNPPYVESGAECLRGALVHEPIKALDGGQDGLDCYRTILRDVPRHLEPGGCLMVEHGFDQRAALMALGHQFGFRVEAALDDAAGHPRVLVLVMGSPGDPAGAGG